MGCFLTRFQNHAVPGSNSPCNQRQRCVYRVIPRRDHKHHAKRFWPYPRTCKTYNNRCWNRLALHPILQMVPDIFHLVDERRVCPHVAGKLPPPQIFFPGRIELSFHGLVACDQMIQCFFPKFCCFCAAGVETGFHVVEELFESLSIVCYVWRLFLHDFIKY